MSNSRNRVPRAGKRLSPARLVALLATVVLVLGLGVVLTQASRQGVSLKPTNQSPYNRRSK